MDLSLDEYIVKKSGFQKSRLGPKISPGRANVLNTQRNAISLQKKVPLQNRPKPGFGVKPHVPGHMHVTAFDARQKITVKDKQQQVQDARQRLAQKNKFASTVPRLQIRAAGAQSRMQPTKMASARPMQVQIRNAGPGNSQGNINIRRPITAPGAPSAPPANHGAQDMRIKIQNSKGKSMDAREKIRARQNAKAAIKQVGNSQPVSASAPGNTTATVRRTGNVAVQLTSHNNPQFNQNITVEKTIHTDGLEDTDVGFQSVAPVQKNLSLKKTIQNSSAIPTVTNRVGNNIVISPNEQRAPFQPQVQVQMQPQVQAQTQPQAYHNVQAPQYSEVQISQPVYSPPQYNNQQLTQSQQYSQPQPQYSQPAPVQQQLHEPMPVIRVVNDSYKVPQATPHVPVVEPDFAIPSSSLQSDNFGSGPLRTTLTRGTQPAQPVQATKSVLQSRLGGISTDESITVTDMSPLQGYRLMITNLHSVVTQDDIVELFGAVGALKKAKLLRAGTAEVVFIKREEALAAVHKYHNRELDGQPMKVVLTTSTQPAVAKPPVDDTASIIQRLPKPTNPTDISSDVDLGLLHKALFKTTSKEDPPTRPVAFTVKI